MFLKLTCRFLCSIKVLVGYLCFAIRGQVAVRVEAKASFFICLILFDIFLKRVTLKYSLLQIIVQDRHDVLISE